MIALIGVMVADDDPIARAALVGVLAAADGIQVVAQAQNGYKRWPWRRGSAPPSPCSTTG
ncbi:hypothetical protein [Micromonospora sp. NPDC023814]|uniref:hypothetical protein n=1 Tax=Micromonospora sp. NPDC023814 TaxID=3154596 RepID=UPI003401C64A